MLIIKDDSKIFVDGTVVVESRKTVGSKSSGEFILDFEDYIALKYSHFYPHQVLGLMRRRDNKNVLLHRYLIEERGFLPPQKCYVTFSDGNNRNLSKHNLLITVVGAEANDITEKLGGKDYLAPRGVVYDELEGVGKFQVYVPSIELEQLFLKGTYDDIVDAILAYRNVLQKSFGDKYHALL